MLLFKDRKNNVSQVCGYNTEGYQNLNSGEVSAEFKYPTGVRLKAYTNDVWVKVENSPVPASTEGLLISQGETIHVFVKKGQRISAHGGSLNIVEMD